MMVGTRFEVYSSRIKALEAAQGINEVYDFPGVTAEVKDYAVDSGEGYCVLTGDSR